MAAYVLDTDKWLVGGASQKVVCAPAGSEGIQTPVSDSGKSVAAYVWITAEEGGCDRLNISLWGTLTGLVSSIEVDPTTDLTTIPLASTITIIATTDRKGVRWHRICMKNSQSSADTWFIKIIRDTADATKISTFWANAAYARVYADELTPEETIPTPPVAWMSSLHFGHDTYPNYVDTALIPGDVNALAIWELESVAGSMFLLIAGRLEDGYEAAGQINPVLEGEAMMTPTADAALHGDFYGRFTQVLGNTTFELANEEFPGPAFNGFNRQPWRVFASLRSSRTDATIRAAFEANGANYNTAWIGNEVEVTSSLAIYDLGTIRPAADAFDLDEDAYRTKLHLEVSGGTGGIGQTHDVDVMLFIPCGHEFLIITARSPGPSAGGTIKINGVKESVIHAQNATLDPLVHGGRRGSLWELPARKGARTFFMFISSLALVVGSHWKVTQLTIRPRARTLMGTR